MVDIRMAPRDVSSLIIQDRYKRAVNSLRLSASTSSQSQQQPPALLPNHHSKLQTATMKFTGLLATLFLAGTAMACANGPYDTGSVCPSNCEGAQRCGDENHVVSPPEPPYKSRTNQ
jgi:hypothetical protein